MKFALFRPVFVIAAIMLCGIGAVCSSVSGAEPGLKPSRAKVEEFVLAKPNCEKVLATEGRFVAVWNEAVVPWVTGGLDAASARGISAAMEPRLLIELNARGFT